MRTAAASMTARAAFAPATRALKARARARRLASRARPTTTTTAAVKEGDRVPEAVLQHFDSEGELRKVSTAELCGDGKTVVLFAVPGAFTPTCSLKHLPGFIKLADEMKDAGADDVVCVSVNDAFVMRAWEKSVEPSPSGRVLLLADGSCLFTRAMDAELDLNEKGLGVRSRRYAMIVEDGVIAHLSMEEGGELNVSNAEHILHLLEADAQ